jgi:hypothetical protein
MHNVIVIVIIAMAREMSSERKDIVVELLNSLLLEVGQGMGY